MILDVKILSPEKVIFKGTAKSVTVPGENGVFEILPHHKRILSRLIKGVVFIDDRSLRIQRGVLKGESNSVTIVIEKE